MIKDSTHELMEPEEGLVPMDQDNMWLRALSSGSFPKPRPALAGRLIKVPENVIVSGRQQRGVKYGK